MDHVQQWTQAYSQAPWRRQTQIAGVFLLFLICGAIIAGIYLNVTAQAATVGRDIQSIQSQVEKMERENEDLQSQLAFLTASSQMEKRARDLGFRPIEMDESVFLPVQGYANRTPIDLAPAPAPLVVSAPTVPPEYTETLGEWLQRQKLDWLLPWAKVQP